MRKFIDKNMKSILIILLTISLIISIYYVTKVINTSSNMSYILYKETVCKIDDCHKDTGLCDVAPPNEVSEEEKNCKIDYNKYLSDLKEDNKEYTNLLFSSSISSVIFIVLTITYVIRLKK